MTLRRNARGFSLAELVIAGGIMVLVAGLSIAAFVSFSRKESIQANASALASALRDARAKTQASVHGSQYGVYIESDRFVTFKGTAYSAGHASNTAFSLSRQVRASSTASSVVFERVSGDASSSVTIDIYLFGKPSEKKTISVQETGLVSVE